MSDSNIAVNATKVPQATGGADNVITVRTAVEENVAVSGDNFSLTKNNEVNLADFLKRDVLIASISVANTDSPTTNIASSVGDVFFEYLSNAGIQTMLSFYDLINMNLCVTVRMISPGACFGAYGVAFICDGGTCAGPEIDSSAYDVNTSFCQDEWGILNPEMDANLCFNLPWVYPQDAVSCVPGSSLNIWRMVVWPLSPITSTLTATATGTIQIYARCTEFNVSNLRFQGLSDKAPVPRDKLSTAAGKMGSALSSAGSAIPFIAPFTTVAAGGLAVVSSFLDAFGFTRQAEPEKPMPMIKRNTSSLTGCDSTDSSEVVALFASNAISTAPQVGGASGEDVCSFASLFERWHYVIPINITTATSVGKIAQIPVTPFFCNSTTALRSFCPAGYVGLPFSCWRGSMEYMIYIPSHSNVKGSMQVLWEGNSVNSGGTAFPTDPTNRLTNVMIDLCGSSRTLLSVDYSSRYPALQCTPQIPSSTWDQASCNGKLTFYLTIPPITTRTGTITFSCLVFMRAGQDMKFAIPRNWMSWYDGTTNQYEPLSIGLQVQGEEEDVVPLQRYPLVSASKNYPLEETLSGESIKSVRCMLQTFSPCADYVRVSATNNANLPAQFPHFWPPKTNVASGNFQTVGNPAGTALNRFTYFGWYMSLFTGIRGGMRYKLLTNFLADPTTGTVLPSQKLGIIAYTDSVNNTTTKPLGDAVVTATVLQDIQPLAWDNGVEFTYPYYALEKFQRCREMNPLSYSNNLLRFDYMNYLEIYKMQGGLFVAGSSDITPVRFRRTPTVLFVTS